MTAAITTLGIRASASQACPRSVVRAEMPAKLRPFISLMSAPAANTFSPPQSTTAPTRSSWPASARTTDLGHACEALARIPKVVIAAVTGYALGGGCEVALTADFRFAAEDARFGQPEILLGVIPGAGGTQRLPRLVGRSKAKEMIYSGRFYGAAECKAMGLVDEVHPAAEVYQRACAAAAGYAKGPGLALRAAKQVIDAGLEAGLDAGLLLERQAFYSLFATEDAAEGMASFVANGPGKATFRNR